MADDGLRARQHDEIMPATQQAGAPAPAPLPVLFLMADTSGGHRNAARARLLHRYSNRLTAPGAQSS